MPKCRRLGASNILATVWRAALCNTQSLASFPRCWISIIDPWGKAVGVLTRTEQTSKVRSASSGVHTSQEHGQEVREQQKQ